MRALINITTYLIFWCLLLLFSECSSHKKTTATNVGNGLYVKSVTAKNNPVFLNRPDNNIICVTVECDELGKGQRLKNVVLGFSDTSGLKEIDKISVSCGVSLSQLTLFGNTTVTDKTKSISGEYCFVNGANQIVISVSLKSGADLTGKLALNDIKMVLGNGAVLQGALKDIHEFRFALVLRAAGQDDCNTYRIPGIVTTGAGTLIAVYDNRYTSSKDLQEDIDIGMSRSTDGGQTWEPMRVIMDMGEYGGRPENMNGTGDPCILYDPVTNTIWVAALWMSGAAPDKMLWWASQPGVSPDTTGQFLLVNSTDDGITWSAPVNITQQIKLPEWQLLLQGPGRGITMNNGTIVFPAQFKADAGEKALDGGQYTSYSTIVYSSDAGKTWHIGKGARSNTTESQVVELFDGTLMLNMRDDRNRSDKSETNGRAVSVTNDMGNTWETHPSSNSLLPEPNCMASLIAADISVNSGMKKVLFFANPDNKTERKNLTIKASLDLGLTWPQECRLELFEDDGYGYSCMTMVDKHTVGIVYEGVKELYFQKILVEDIIRGK